MAIKHPLFDPSQGGLDRVHLRLDSSSSLILVPPIVPGNKFNKGHLQVWKLVLLRTQACRVVVQFTTVIFLIAVLHERSLMGLAATRKLQSPPNPSNRPWVTEGNFPDHLTSTVPVVKPPGFSGCVSQLDKKDFGGEGRANFPLSPPKSILGCNHTPVRLALPSLLSSTRIFLPGKENSFHLAAR